MWKGADQMAYIVFFDTEIQPESGQILDIGALRDDGIQFHSQSISSFFEFVKGTSFFCGHNIIAHDLHYVDAQLSASAPNYLAIDTLCLSPLLFPMRPYHKLVKDDKLQSGSLNNPLNDAIKAKQLFDDEISAYRRLPAKLRRIFCGLLSGTKEFFGFFRLMNEQPSLDPEGDIREYFHSKICTSVDLSMLIRRAPIELAYTLALVNTHDRHSVPPAWVLRNYPRINNVIRMLRHTPCAKGCPYCSRKLDVTARLKDIFGFDSSEPITANPYRKRPPGPLWRAVPSWPFSPPAAVNPSPSSSPL